MTIHIRTNAGAGAKIAAVARQSWALMLSCLCACLLSQAAGSATEAVAAAGVAGAVEATGNLLVNGNFAAGLVGWDAQFGQVEVGPGRDGRAGATQADAAQVGVAQADAAQVTAGSADGGAEVATSEAAATESGGSLPDPMQSRPRLVLLGTDNGSGVGQKVAGLRPGQTIRVSAHVQITSGYRPVYLVVNGQRLWTQSATGRDVAFNYTLAPGEDTLQVWLWFDARDPGDRAEVAYVEAVPIAEPAASVVLTNTASGEQVPDFFGAAASLEGDPRAWFGVERVVYMQLGMRRDLLNTAYSGPGRVVAVLSQANRYQIVYMGIGTEVTTDISAVGITNAKARRWVYSVTGLRTAAETIDVKDGRFKVKIGRDEITVVEIFPTQERFLRVNRLDAAPQTTLDELQAPRYHVSMWYPTWIGDKGLNALRTYGNLIDEVNFFWYDMQAGGALASKSSSGEDLAALALAWQAGCLVVPTVTNGGFNATVTHNVLSNPEARDRQIKALVDLAVRHGYDGLDLDFESMAAADRELFSRFVEDVAAALHEQKKLLSVTVYAKTSDYSNAQAEDYVRIGKAADMVKLMVYNYSYSGGSPGPVSPAFWGDQVLTYARQSMPAGKVIYGLPWYGYDWPAGSKATSVDLPTARQLAQSKGVQIKRDASSLEPSFSYKDGGGRDHIVYFQDGESYAARLRLMQNRHGDILGVAHWQIGNEMPEFWEVLRALRQGGL